MNNEEFYSEIQEYEKKRFELHQKYQSIAVEIFKEFHRVCIKNNIAYYGVYGTLLGALRDDGFIPWDLDVDTIVAIEDRYKEYMHGVHLAEDMEKKRNTEKAKTKG